MFTKVIPADKVNQNLIGLVRSMAGYLGCQVEIQPQVMIHTDCEKLIEMIEHALSLPLQGGVNLVEKAGEHPATVEVKAPEAPAVGEGQSGKTCKYCGTPITRGKICGGEICKQKQVKEY